MSKPKNTLTDLESVIGKISKEQEQHKKNISKTSEVSIQNIAGIEIEKRIPKVSITFRTKASTIKRIDAILKIVKKENSYITKTDICNALLEKGLEVLELKK